MAVQVEPEELVTVPLSPSRASLVEPASVPEPEVNQTAAAVGTSSIAVTAMTRTVVQADTVLPTIKVL